MCMDLDIRRLLDVQLTTPATFILHVYRGLPFKAPSLKMEDIFFLIDLASHTLSTLASSRTPLHYEQRPAAL